MYSPEDGCVRLNLELDRDGVELLNVLLLVCDHMSNSPRVEPEDLAASRERHLEGQDWAVDRRDVDGLVVSNAQTSVSSFLDT